MNFITVRVEDRKKNEYPAGTLVSSLIPAASPPRGLPIIAAMINNNVSSLSYPLAVNCEVRFLTMQDPHGWRIYRNSLCFLLAKAVRELFPNASFSIDHSFGLGLYCSFHPRPTSTAGITPTQIRRIERRMHELVKENVRIERRKISFTDAVSQFESAGQNDKLNLLKYRNPPHVLTHWCDGFSDLAHGPLAPTTGVLTSFRLIPYKPGFVLDLPDRDTPSSLCPFEDQPHLFNIFQEHKEWGRILGVNTVGRLNETIAKGQIEDFIKTAEALHEKKVARIADCIAQSQGRIKFVLIAGPSSAGKTTFAKRLSVHLTVNGIRPVTIATDDYFVAHRKTPRDEEGKMDYEHVEAVDLRLFNHDLQELMKGREIELPRFNFNKKRPEASGRMLRIDDGKVLIIEGIHGLNPRLTHMVRPAHKFKIYISALTQLNLDYNNRISTTDNRLMRRMVRDYKFRGHAALDTLRMWPSVRRGEKRWIFPFQREADATFNSALDYELAVLKPLVEPLLMQVKPSDPEYAEARRLSEFLLNFLPTPERHVPGTSILREYIGRSSFHY